jgi:ABC-type tungstate transport system permease subunit
VSPFDSDASRKAEYDRVAKLFTQFVGDACKYGDSYTLKRVVLLHNEQLERKFLEKYQHICRTLSIANAAAIIDPTPQFSM